MVLKTAGEIELMDEANAIVHRVLDGIDELIAPGVTTRELDEFAEQCIREAGAVPAFLNYRGYPATLCTSINDVIVHGIPDDQPLEEGDIVGPDLPDQPANRCISFRVQARAERVVIEQMSDSLRGSARKSQARQHALRADSAQPSRQPKLEVLR